MIHYWGSSEYRTIRLKNAWHTKGCRILIFFRRFEHNANLYKKTKKDQIMRKAYLCTTNLLSGMKGFWNGVLWGMGFRKVAAKRRKKCRFCKRQIPADTKYCPYCGKRLRGR